MAKVLNFGSLNLDYVYSVPHFVSAGETLSSYNMEVICGGKGLNQSVALSRAGAKVYHAGKIGFNGGILKDMLKILMTLILWLQTLILIKLRKF